MMADAYDVIVVGAGGVGSAAAWRLAQRGVRVLAIDRFRPPHNLGSSHGQTRIIRHAYFEHPDYVPLTHLASKGWAELEALVGRKLYVETGLLQVGPADGMVLRGVVESARRHALDVEQLAREELQRRWPAFSPPEDAAGVFERHAGFLLVEGCVQAQIDAAKQAGAHFLFNAVVHAWKCERSLVVHTSVGDFHADRLVIAAGPWAEDLLASERIQLRVLRKSLFWYECRDARLSAAAGCPAFLFELPNGVFYGFPEIDACGLKVAEHSGGGEIGDPNQIDRTASQPDVDLVEGFLRRVLPGATGPRKDFAVCMYTMSPDEHFIVDRLPADPRVVVAAGMSGHGFKFTPVLGTAVADLSIGGATSLPMEFLSLARFTS